MGSFENICLRVWVWGVLIFLVACSSQKKVISFTNDDVNFEKYTTYNIVNYKKGDQDFSNQGAVFINKIEKGISNAMNSKQYSKSTTPDILVRYEIISAVNVNSNNNFNRRAYRNVNRYDPFYNPHYNTTRQIEGVLLIELKDQKSKKLIWQGSLDLRYSRKTEKNEDLLLNAVQDIFNKYNYVAGSSKPQTES